MIKIYQKQNKMAIRTRTTKTVTMTGATSTSTISNVHGRIKSIAIKPSGVSTDFRISCNKAGVTEYIFGASGAISVAAAGIVITPQKLAVDADNGALTVTSNTYVDFIANNQDITVSVSAGAADETYIVDIIVEE